MLTLMEEMVLLALHEEKGTIRNSASMTLGNGLAGAILLELALQKKIRLDEQYVRIENEIPAGHSMLDDVTNQIQAAKKPKNVEGWISRFQFSASKRLKAIYQQLVQKRIVGEEERRVLFFFHTFRHPLKKKKARRDILARIRSVMRKKRDPDTRTVCLLSLIQACGWIPILFDRDERKEAKMRIKEIVEVHSSTPNAVPLKMGQMIHKQVATAVMAQISATASSSQ